MLELTESVQFVVTEPPAQEFFIEDVLKAEKGAVVSGHKYIRRYRVGDTWRYVYQEPQGRNRREITETQWNDIRTLAELNNRRARFLTESVETVKPRSSDPLDMPIFSPQRGAMIDSVRGAIRDVLSPLSDRYRDTSPFARKFQEAGLNMETLVTEAATGDTLREVLESVARVSKKLDDVFQGISPALSSQAQVRALGGYGEFLYNATLRRLQTSSPGAILPGRLPYDYHRFHQVADKLTPTATFNTTATRQTLEARESRRVAERAAREEAARAEMMRAYEGSMTSAVVMHMSGTVEVDKVAKIHNFLTSVFGQNLKAEDFPYDLSSAGFKTTITSLSVDNDHMGMTMQVTLPDGTPVTDSFTRNWYRNYSEGYSNQNLPQHIHNDYLIVNPSQRGSGARIGDLVNTRQFDFMKKYVPNGSISVTAALDVGGYNWCNTGFSFASTQQLNTYRRNFQAFARQHGISLSDEDMREFKEPCHFAGFNDGRKYEIAVRSGVKLSPKQIEAKTLDGKEGGKPLTVDELQSGRTNRMLVHLGKKFMLGQGWGGVIRTSAMNDNNQAWRFYKNYRIKNDESWQSLDPSYKAVVERARATVSANPNPPPVQTPTGYGSSGYSAPSTAQRYGTSGGASTRRRATVRRPNDFGSWNYARQTQWIESNRDQMSFNARTAARSIISATREEFERAKSFLQTSMPADLVSRAPVGMISGLGGGNHPKTGTPEQINEAIRSAQNWNREAYNWMGTMPGTTPEESATRMRTRERIDKVVTDYVYRLRNPNFRRPLRAAA